MLTVTGIAADVVWFPAASLAIAVSVCEPLMAVVVSHDAEYGELVSSEPRLFPSSTICTPMTPTLSEASAATAIVPEMVEPEMGKEIDTNGGMMSVARGGVPPDECL